MRIVAAMNAAATSVSTQSPLQQLLPEGLFDFWAGKLNPLWTLQRPLARLLAREPAGRGSATLILRTNRHWRGLKAGQHVTLGVEIGGRRLLRSYSPTDLGGGRIAITVKAVEGGAVSQHLLETARIGEIFSIDQAFGEMLLPAPSRPLLLLAAGSGITPMRALLRAATARGQLQAPVELLYWVREREEFCFVEELQALAAAQPLLKVRLLATGDAVQAPRIGDYPLEEILELAERQVFACGPSGFVEAARSRLQGQVVGFLAEAFSPPEDLPGEDGEVEVHLARSGRTLRLPRNLSLLEGLEAQGLRPKHGCRMGICNTCACSRQAGTTRNLANGERSDEPAVPVKLCVNAPSTDLTLDL